MLDAISLPLQPGDLRNTWRGNLRGGAAIAPDILRLYRGIAVPVNDVDETIEGIKTNGLGGLGNTDGRQWVGTLRDFSAEELFRDPLSFFTDRVEFPIVWACGDEGGAAYYAHRPRATKELTPLIIEFDAPVEDCQVDCKDLLASVFGLWDARGGSSRSEVLTALRQIFGESIARYFEAAAATGEAKIRTGLCSAATYDREVVLGHYSNDVCWQGRYEVRCRSAFTVRTPVPPTRIVGVRRAYKSQIPTPTITLDDLLRREEVAKRLETIDPAWLTFLHEAKREHGERQARERPE